MIFSRLKRKSRTIVVGERDYIVVEYPDRLSMAQRRYALECLQSGFRSDRVVVLDSGAKVYAVRRHP